MAKGVERGVCPRSRRVRGVANGKEGEGHGQGESCGCNVVHVHLCVPTCVYLPVCTYLCAPTCVYLPVCTYLCVPTCVYLGEGILSEVDGAVYEGSFHDNRRHGEGMQLYK